jgi:hypothetical protein
MQIKGVYPSFTRLLWISAPTALHLDCIEGETPQFRMCTPPWIRPGSVLRQVPNFGFVLVSVRFTLSFFCVFVFKRKQAHKQFAGHMTKIIRKLRITSDSIVACVTGQCGQLCKKHSLVCSGGRKVWSQHCIASSHPLKILPVLCPVLSCWFRETFVC